MLFADVPVTALLDLEKRITEIFEFASSIPTYDPAKGFTPDDSKGKGIYVAREERRTRTKKDKKVITLAPATDKHPAQAQLVDVDVPTGTVTTQEWSGLMTPSDKGEILERVEEARRAIKKARSRANDQAVPDLPFSPGKQLLDYVFGQTK